MWYPERAGRAEARWHAFRNLRRSVREGYARQLEPGSLRGFCGKPLTPASALPCRQGAVLPSLAPAHVPQPVSIMGLLLVLVLVVFAVLYYYYLVIRVFIDSTRVHLSESARRSAGLKTSRRLQMQKAPWMGCLLAALCLPARHIRGFSAGGARRNGTAYRPVYRCVPHVS